MTNPTENTVWDEIKRVARELKGPLEQITLKQFGLGARKLEVIVDIDEVCEVSKADPSYRWLEDGQTWWRHVKPSPLKILNSGQTRVTIKEIHVVAKIKSPIVPLSFGYSNIHNNMECWIVDFLKAEQTREKVAMLPSLTSGTFLPLEFDRTVLISPDSNWLSPLLSDLNNTADRRKSLKVERADHAVRETKHNDSDLITLEERAREAFMVVEQCQDVLEFSLIIVLHDGAWLPFEWKKDLGKFVPGSFSLGLSAT